MNDGGKHKLQCTMQKRTKFAFGKCLPNKSERMLRQGHQERLLRRSLEILRNLVKNLENQLFGGLHMERT